MHLAGFAPALALSLCDSEAHANRQMPIASVVSGNPEKGKIPLSYEDNDQNVIAENQRLMWSLARSIKTKERRRFMKNKQKESRD